jgi:hypothetical protein
MHSVYVEYDGGLNSAMDNRIMAAADYNSGQESQVSCDSGCMLCEEMTRDFSFHYKSSESALEAERKLKEIPALRVRVELAS